jgi:hypothetical protein
MAAAEVTFTRDGGVQAKAPVNKIGALVLADGLAIMSGATIEVVSKGPDGTQHSQLKGKLFKSEQIGTGVDGVISGFAWFTDGPGLSFLDKGSCSEQVDLNNGDKVPGPIQDITADQVIAGGRTIAMSDVRLVHSKHVFQFRAVGEKVSRMNFEPTCVKAPPTEVKKVGKSKAFKITVAIIVAAVIATAIAVPIAVACGGGGGHHSPPPSPGGGGGTSGTSASSGTGSIADLGGYVFPRRPPPPPPPNGD